MDRFAENSRRMLRYNREFALSRYMGTVEPERPLLVTATGIEVRYSPVTVQVPAESSSMGDRLDDWGYFSDTGNTPLPPGTLYHHPGTGGIYCAVETPDPNGGFASVWIRIT